MGLSQSTGDIRDVRPKLRHDVVFFDAPAGAYLRGADTAFVMKGRTAFKWLTTLSPYLNGEHSLRRICANLDDDQEQTVLGVVRALLERGFAKDGGGRSPIAEPLARRFARQIEFIDHFTDDPTGRFLRFHGTRVLLTGAGGTLVAAVAGLLRNGCTRLEVYPEDGPAGFADLRAEADELRAEGIRVDLRIHDEAPAGVGDVDAVVHCGDSRTLGGLRELAAACHAGGPLLVPVFWHNDRAVLGPTAGAGQTPCWLCAALRTSANAGPAAARFWRDLAIGPTGSGDPAVDEPAARMIGNAAAFELFRAVTGALEPDTESSVVILDLSTLESYRERVLPHPACPVCRDTPVSAAPSGLVAEPTPIAEPTPTAIAEPTPTAIAEPTSAMDTDDEVYQRAGSLVSDHAGVFIRFVDDALEQAPLKTARLAVPADGGHREITAFDVHTVMGARLGAYRAAVQQYVAALARPDLGQIATAREMVDSGREAVPYDELLLSAGVASDTPDRSLHWLPATALGPSGTAVWVPAAAALPRSAENAAGWAERTIAGTAAGATVDEVIDSGLASAVSYAALVALMRGDGELVPIGEEALTADDDIALVIKAARRFGCEPRVYALSGAAPVHAVLAVAPGTDHETPLWTIAGGYSATSTRLAALRDLAGLLQVRRFEGVDADLGDPLLAELDPHTLLAEAASTAATTTALDTTRAYVLTALAEKGHTALLVDTTTRDLIAAGAFRTGTVLLRRPA